MTVLSPPCVQKSNATYSLYPPVGGANTSTVIKAIKANSTDFYIALHTSRSEHINGNAHIRGQLHLDVPGMSLIIARALAYSSSQAPP